MKIKMIAVKRHTSVPCIPLTSQFVVKVMRLYNRIDNELCKLTCRDENGNRIILPNSIDDAKCHMLLETFDMLDSMINAFESECESEV